MIITLETTDKHLIGWGHIPGAELPGEPAAVAKLETMSRWLQQQRASQSAPAKLDLLRANSALPVSG
ncbi:MAG: hypothetical protein R3C53_23480 [Pirellulaceae bacterium]